MANIGQAALTVVGAVVGSIVPGVGTAIGAQLGAAVGSLIFPTELPAVFGPRLDDLNIQVSTYGNAIPLIYGPTNRVAGNVFWSTGLIEDAETEEQGGKGGGSQEVTTYTYRTSVAVAYNDRESVGINKIWCNGKVIFDESEINPNWDPDNPVEADFEYALISTPLDGGGYIITAQPTIYEETLTGNLTTTRPPLSTLVNTSGDDTILGTLNFLFHGAPVSVFKSIRFYPGHYLQEPDSVIETYLGAGEAPAYRGTCYIVIEDLQLADFGNGLPNIQVELVADEVIYASEIVRDICERCGLDDTAGAPFVLDSVPGYQISKAMKGNEAILPLALAYDFDMVEQYGCVRGQQRAYAVSATIPLEEMGCVGGNDNPTVDYLTWTRNANTDTPKTVTVSYPDIEFDYQVVSQSASRDDGDSDANLDFELPIAVGADRARQIAEKILWSRWAENRFCSFSVSDRWARLTVGEIVAVPVADTLQPVRIKQITRGDNGVINVEANFEDYLAYTSTLDGAPVTAPLNEVRLHGPSEIYVIDTPPMREVDDNNGFYWAVTSQDTEWRGASVQRSTDMTATFNEMASTGIRARVGDVAVALPSGTSVVIDEANTLTVVMQNTEDALSSVTELEMFNGRNSAWLGPVGGEADFGEIIQWRDATLIAPRTYELTGLLRGRLATEHAIATHDAAEAFIVLNSAIGSSDFGQTDWDKIRHYIAASFGQTITDANPVRFINTGERKRPRAPVHMIGERDGSNNLTIEWVRRTRIPITGLATPAPLGETTEAYEIDVYDGPDVVRTITATSETASYTAAEQTADGLTPGDPVTIAVYQISETRGRGRPGDAVV